ncbi:MAG: hypothetical protein JHC31_07035 [Sulfurihydrogenibium sp.]|jgi:DNA repair exonuclease SbcCD nuclease subunit|nr:hypothetical protein [Sulfurihydrogenibium sp.]
MLNLDLERITERYIEIVRKIKELEEEKEKLRKMLIDSEKEEIRTKNGAIRIIAKKYAILDEKKIILTLSKQELAEVVTISISRFKKFAESNEGKFDVENFVAGYKETKEVLVNLPKS